MTGPQTLNYIYNTIPPAPTDFEAKYLGISDSVIHDSLWWLGDVSYDTLVVDADSITTVVRPTWQYQSDFTWLVKEPGLTGYPDSMKIDVAKNGAQVGCDASLNVMRPGVIPIFKVGLDVNNEQPPDYGAPCGWIYFHRGVPISATLGFDTFSEGEPEMRQTFHTILDQFGEGPGL